RPPGGAARQGPRDAAGRRRIAARRRLPRGDGLSARGERPACAIARTGGLLVGPTLETARLILRPPREEDLDGWAELMGDEETARYIGGPMTRSAAWRTMATMAGSWQLKGFGMFSVVEKETGRWIGRVGPWQPEQWPGT